MFGGMQRYGNPSLKPKAATPHPGAIHHRFAGDWPAARHHRADSTALLFKGFDTDPLQNTNPFIPRAARQRLRGIRRIGLTVSGQKDCANQILRRHDWI